MGAQRLEETAMEQRGEPKWTQLITNQDQKRAWLIRKHKKKKRDEVNEGRRREEDKRRRW